MEEITATLHNKEEVCFETWRPWNYFVYTDAYINMLSTAQWTSAFLSMPQERDDRWSFLLFSFLPPPHFISSSMVQAFLSPSLFFFTKILTTLLSLCTVCDGQFVYVVPPCVPFPPPSRATCLFSYTISYSTIHLSHDIGLFCYTSLLSLFC